MSEQNSLFLLADVALHNIKDPCCNVHSRKKSRLKILQIKQLDEEYYAEINELKGMPISILFKIFIDKFKDEKLRSVIYICKFGIQSYCCNTRFIDSKENKTETVEHLIRCHLLEHLTKIKAGVMIKLPKKSVGIIDKNLKMNLFYNKLNVSNNAKIKLTQADKNYTSKFNDKKIEINTSENDESNLRSVNLYHAMNIEHVCEKRKISNLGYFPMKMTSLNLLKKMRMKTHVNILGKPQTEKWVSDHSYAKMDQNKSIMTHVTSPEYAAIYIQRQNININNLYHLNSELSEELTNFMLSETLEHPVYVYIIEGKNLIVEELPLIGSEVEIITNNEYSASFEITSNSGYDIFHCQKCAKIFVSKKNLMKHLKVEHNTRKMDSRRKPLKDNRNINETNKILKKKNAAKYIGDKNNNRIFVKKMKENNEKIEGHKMQNGISILKTALLKDYNVKKPIISISNIWNNINVQYI